MKKGYNLLKGQRLNGAPLMKNNDFMLSKKDYSMFSVLSNTEKIEYLYRKELMNQCSNDPAFKQRSENLIDKPKTAKVNVIFVDKFIIISSNNEPAGKVTAMKLIEDGFVLQKTLINTKFLIDNFHLNYKFNACYTMVAMDTPLCYN